MIVTPAELENKLRITVDAGQAEAVIDEASAEVASACPGWQLTPTTSTVVLQGTGTVELALPRPPITDVTSVTGPDGTVTGWTLVSTVTAGERRDRLVNAAGWDADDTFTVVYEHGFDDDTRPQVVKNVTLRLAARLWVNPEQVMQKRRGDYSASFGSSAVEVSGLTRWERKLLADNGLRKTSR
jgi:hypothetical protein